MIIRPFRESDAQEVSTIKNATLKYNNDDEETKRALRGQNTPEAIIEKSKERTFYVAETKGTIVGIAGYLGNEVKTVFVHPTHHKRGIGKALVQHVLQEIKRQGYAEAFVKSSTYAEPFYAKLGFEKIKRERVEYHGSQLTLTRMVKRNL